MTFAHHLVSSSLLLSRLARRSAFDEIHECRLKADAWTAVRAFLAPRGIVHETICGTIRPNRSQNPRGLVCQTLLFLYCFCARRGYGPM